MTDEELKYLRRLITALRLKRKDLGKDRYATIAIPMRYLPWVIEAIEKYVEKLE